MPAANKLNLTINQGETFTRTLTITTPGTPPDPVDITNDTFAGQIRTSYISSVTTKEFTCTILDGAAGILSVSLAETDTAELRAGTVYVYDIEQTSVIGVTRLLWGNIKVTPEVTR